MTILSREASAMKRLGIWAGSLAWMIFLFWLSSENGEATTRTSRALAVFLLPLLRLSPEHLLPLEAALRSAAHFVGFFILGLLAYAAVRLTWKQAKGAALWAIGVCSALGIADEVKKLWIAGRHLHWEEAGLNVLGACCGVALCGMLFALGKAIRKKRTRSFQKSGGWSLAPRRPGSAERWKGPQAR